MDPVHVYPIITPSNVCALFDEAHQDVTTHKQAGATAHVLRIRAEARLASIEQAANSMIRAGIFLTNMNIRMFACCLAAAAVASASVTTPVFVTAPVTVPTALDRTVEVAVLATTYGADPAQQEDALKYVKLTALNSTLRQPIYHLDLITLLVDVKEWSENMIGDDKTKAMRVYEYSSTIVKAVLGRIVDVDDVTLAVGRHLSVPGSVEWTREVSSALKMKSSPPEPFGRTQFDAWAKDAISVCVYFQTVDASSVWSDAIEGIEHAALARWSSHRARLVNLDARALTLRGSTRPRGITALVESIHVALEVSTPLCSTMPTSSTWLHAALASVARAEREYGPFIHITGLFTDRLQQANDASSAAKKRKRNTEMTDKTNKATMRPGVSAHVPATEAQPPPPANENNDDDIVWMYSTTPTVIDLTAD
jgi:hypothetical protein